MLALHHPSSIFSLERLPPPFCAGFLKIRIESRWIAVSSPSVFGANYAFSEKNNLTNHIPDLHSFLTSRP